MKPLIPTTIASAPMITQSRTFLRLGFIAILGSAFYYSHLFLGLVANDNVAMLLAITFCLSTVPLPIIAVGNRKLFPNLEKRNMHLLGMGSILLLVHNFLMTFLFVMILPGKGG